MEKEKRELKGARELRRKAEERLKEKPAVPEKPSELETQELIQELRVHQIELEMQNEELRRVQAVVEESRAKYSDLYDFAPVGYLTLNMQGIILEANLSACSKLGKERSLLISIYNLFTNFIIKKGEKDLFYQHLKKVFEAKSLETCELELKGKGDTKFYAQLQSIVVKDNLSQCRTVIIDITENKQAEEKIVRLHQQNELILSTVAEGIIGLDLQGNHTFVNPAAAKMLGYEVEELLCRPSHSTWHHTKLDGSPYPPEECEIYAAFQEGVMHRVYTEVFWRKDGASFPIEYASTPVYKQGGLASKSRQIP